MHADCIADKLVENPYYADREMHIQGLLRSSPLNACNPKPKVTALVLKDEVDHALRELDDEPAPGALLSERAVLRNLAGKPIVRPTSASVSGNIDEVLTARRWIAIALESKGELDEKVLEELHKWLAKFNSKYVINGWREAVLRAQGARAGKELNRMMRLASGKDTEKQMLNLRADVCFHCGIPI